jgi:general secretion pathway protein F/type IV pilus assembly protein PilC
VFFVPKFAELFEKLEREGGGLPVATVALLSLSDFLGRFGGIVLLGLIGIVWGFRQAVQSPKGKEWYDRVKLRIPVLGPIFLNYAVARFCRVLGTLLRNGVPLLKALDISSQSAGNRILEQAIRKSAENVSSGETLSKPLAQCGLLPKPVMAMIAVAEQANNLDQVLVQIAESVERRLARQIDLMVRMVEPAMLLVMGVIIMFVLVALLLPIIEISTSL